MAAVPVIIVPYDPSWPRKFERESALLAEIFSGTSTAIEHIGSTAIPNLGAKPIIDIMVGVSALADVESRIPELEAQGYQYVPEFEAQIPERRYFRKPQEGIPTHHLHAVARESAFWKRHLLFRDYLRANPKAAAAYSELKQQLAARHRTERIAYTEGKSEFVESVLRMAAARQGTA